MKFKVERKVGRKWVPVMESDETATHSVKKGKHTTKITTKEKQRTVNISEKTAEMMNKDSHSTGIRYVEVAEETE